MTGLENAGFGARRRPFRLLGMALLPFLCAHGQAFAYSYFCAGAEKEVCGNPSDCTFAVNGALAGVTVRDDIPVAYSGDAQPATILGITIIPKNPKCQGPVGNVRYAGDPCVRHAERRLSFAGAVQRGLRQWQRADAGQDQYLFADPVNVLS